MEGLGGSISMAGQRTARFSDRQESSEQLGALLSEEMAQHYRYPIKHSKQGSGQSVLVSVTMFQNIKELGRL